MTGLDAPPNAPSLKIASRRSAIDRVWGSALALVVLVILAGVVAIAFLASAVDGGGVAFVALVPLGFFNLLIVWTIVRTWRQVRSITTPLELDAGGLVLHAPQGSVRCPWEAVTSVGFGRNALTRVLVVRLHPQAGPGVPGIESTLPRRGWRVVHRHGLRYAAWLLDIDDAELADAVAHFSSGRVQLVPRA